MRVLLATEGPSDEIVAEALLRDQLPRAEIVRKRFPARGVKVVLRAIDTLVRAAYFSRFELLVIHFDLNDSLPERWRDVSESSRLRDVADKVAATLANVRAAEVGVEPALLLMTPVQSTDAWLIWGRDNEDGHKLEALDRHRLKRDLFGDPPRGLLEKSEDLAAQLLVRVKSAGKLPYSLSAFLNTLQEAARRSC